MWWCDSSSCHAGIRLLRATLQATYRLCTAHAMSPDCAVYIYSSPPSFLHPLPLSLALDLHNIAIRSNARYNPLLP
jgi:hypothetical protein